MYNKNHCVELVDEETSEASQTPECAKILIVEDEEELAELLDLHLRREGFTTIIAQDGVDACRLVESEIPDMVLLDLLLPKLDGWQVCKLIRSHPDEAIAAVPIAMLTALGTLKDKYKGLKLGADLYIPKPYSVREIVLNCKNLITRRKRLLSLLAQAEKKNGQRTLQNDIQSLLVHELRNQLTVISGMARRLIKTTDLEPYSSEKNKKYLQILSDSSSYLSNISEEILYMNEIAAGNVSFPLEELCLWDSIDEVAEILQPMAQQKQIQIKVLPFPQDWKVKFNRAAFRLALSSLVGNALKYSRDRQRVTMKCTSEPNQNQIQIDVIDHGPGIPSEEQTHIFECFYRGKKTRINSQGTGMGLYIAKTLVEAMGGKIRLWSIPGQGSCFQIVLKT